MMKNRPPVRGSLALDRARAKARVAVKKILFTIQSYSTLLFFALAAEQSSRVLDLSFLLPTL